MNGPCCIRAVEVANVVLRKKGKLIHRRRSIGTQMHGVRKEHLTTHNVHTAKPRMNGCDLQRGMPNQQLAFFYNPLECWFAGIVLLPDNILVRVPGKLYTQCTHEKRVNVSKANALQVMQ